MVTAVGIPDGNRVQNYAQWQDPNNPGKYTGFTVTTQFYSNQATADWSAAVYNY